MEECEIANVLMGNRQKRREGKARDTVSLLLILELVC